MKPPKLRNLLVNLGLSVLSLGLCLALAEGVLRSMGYGNVEVYQPDPVLYWRLKPNQTCFTKIGHKPVRVNAQGTRGPEFQPAKPPNTLRVLSLGDSRTFGWGLSEAETYSGVLEESLRAHLGSRRRVEVINAGVNAWSFAQMRVYFRDIGLGYQPDFVLVGGANLWTQFSEQNSPEFVRRFMRRVWLKNLLRRFALYHFVVEVKLKQIYERERVRFIPVDPKTDALFKEQQQRDPDAFFREAIEGLCRLAQTNRVQPVLLFLPVVEELTASNPPRVLRIMTDISRQLQVPLVDVTPDLADKGKDYYLEADPVHLNAEGSRRVGLRLFQTLTNLLSP